MSPAVSRGFCFEPTGEITLRKTAIATILLLLAACGGAERPAPGAPAEGGQGTTGATPSAAAAPAAASGGEVGNVLPDFEAVSLDGSKFDLQSKRGKVVLLNLWATWCGPCRYEIPELQRMHDALASRGFEVVGVSVDESGLDAVRQFVTENHMTYPIALDEPGKLASLLQSSVLPTSVVLDREGKIVWKKFGLIRENDPELKSAIEGAL
jgi:peroxiredoxin